MTPKLKGTHPWLVILCCPRDQSIPAWPARDYFTSFISEQGAGGLFDYWSQVSGRRLDLAGSRVLGWYRLTQTLAEIDAIDRSAAAAVARAAAAAAGENLSGYRYTLAFFVGSGHFGAQGSDVAASISSTRGQPGWRWCSKCEGLTFWDGSRQPGLCAGGDRHDHAGSGLYSVEHDTTIADGETGWRWCRLCESLVFSTPTPTPAPCPSGSPHSFGSDTAYVIRAGRAGSGEQNNWKRCSRCQCLAHDDPGRGPGRCPVGGLRHDHAGSANYNVAQGWSATLGGLAHESGHAFGLGHAFGPSREGDIGNDDQPGAYGDWTDIMSWANSARFSTPRFTPAGPGLSAAMLHKLGWVNDEEVARLAAGSGTRSVTLVPLYGGAAGVRMVQVIRAPDRRIYTASYRPAEGWDRGFGTGRVIVHAQRTLYSTGQDCWARCVNCEGMIYGGTMLCPAGGLHDGGGSQDYGLLCDVGPSGGQTNWRWCRKCEGLAFAGGGTNGHCPAGGGHDFAGSADYAIPTGGSGQHDWRWCNKCQGMVFKSGGMSGACPAGGLHDHSRSGNYVLSNGVGPNRQNRWRWCDKCQGLFYAGRGRCRGDDVHRLSGTDYALALNLDRASGQTGWAFCSKCRALAFYDGSRAAGACPAGGAHDHGASGRYTLPADAEARAAQRWNHCSRCGALHYIDAARGAGPCAAGGTHSRSREYEVALSTTGVPGDARFRWCRRCECMVLGDNPSGCSGGGAHDTSTGGPYVVRTNPSTLLSESSFWRVCANCNILMQLPRPGDPARPCPGGSMHDPRGEYFVTISMGFTKWRWCRRCEALAYWDGSRPPGPCPAGDRHDHGGSNFYSPPHLGEAVQVVDADLRAGERYVADIGGTTFEVVSIDSASATVRVTT